MTWLHNKEGMKYEEICQLSRLIGTLWYCSTVLLTVTPIVFSVFTSAHSEVEYGSGISDYCSLIPYLSDDGELLRSFYISDNEQEEKILKSLDQSAFELSETEGEAQAIASSSQLALSGSHSKQLFVLPTSQNLRLASQSNFILSSYQINCITPSTSKILNSFVSASSDKQLQLRQSAFESLISPWSRRFLSCCRRDMLLPVPRDFCADNFNLIMLPPIIEWIGRDTNTSIEGIAKNATLVHQQRRYPIFRQALKLLTQNGPLPCNIPENLERATTGLYLLLHQRYISSPRGLDVIRRRFLPGPLSSSLQDSRQASVSRKYNIVNPIFGRCPNLCCRGMPLLPIGNSDILNVLSMPSFGVSSSLSIQFDVDAAESRAKRFCALCCQVFYNWDSKVDGCAWGTTFCHLFLIVYGKEVFGNWNSFCSLSDREYQSKNVIVGRVFGFRLHPSVLDFLHPGTSST